MMLLPYWGFGCLTKWTMDYPVVLVFVAPENLIGTMGLIVAMDPVEWDRHLVLSESGRMVHVIGVQCYCEMTPKCVPSFSA